MDIEQALDKYLEHFGKPYPLGVCSGKTAKQVIAEITRYISSNIPAPEPEYEDDCDY